MLLRSRRLPAPRRSQAASARPAPARRSPRPPATCSKSPRTRPACSACALGPNTRPDYGIVVGRARACTIDAARPAARGRSPTATRRSRSPARRCAFALLWKGAPVLHVDHRRALPRLDAAAGVRPLAARRTVDGGVRARSRASRSTASARSSARSTSAASSSTRRSRTRSASTPGSPTRTRRSPGARARARGAWGVFVHTPGDGDARRRPSGLVASQLRDRRRRRGARPVPVRRPTRRPASSTPTRSSPAARRPCRAGASACGCRARTTRRRRKPIAVAQKLRERRIPCDVLTLDGRAAWKVETRFNFELGPRALPGSARGARRDQGAAPARLRLGVSVRLGARAAVRRARAARLPAEDAARRPATCSRWDTAPGAEPVRRRADAAAGERHRRFHQSRRLRVVARRARGAVRRRRRRDQERLRRARARRRGRATTATAAARLHNVYPLLYNHCVFEATAQVPARTATRRRSCGAAPAGPAASAIRWAGAAIRRATGRASRRRSAAACRGA